MDSLSGATALAIESTSFEQEKPTTYGLGPLTQPAKQHWSETSGQQIMEHGVIVSRD